MQSLRKFSTQRLLLAPKQFLVVAKDFSDPECLQRRLEVRQQHLEQNKVLKEQGIVQLGGALLDSHESSVMKGSALVFNVESIDQVEKIIQGDPYVKNKVWESWDIYPFRSPFKSN